jgi:hypothetical protein
MIKELFLLLRASSPPVDCRAKRVGVLSRPSSERVKVHLGTGDPCGSHATASRPCLLRSLIKPLYLLHSRKTEEQERRLLLSWARAGKDSEGRSKATRSEGDDLEESAARAPMRHGGGGDVAGEVRGVDEVGLLIVGGFYFELRVVRVTVRCFIEAALENG